jgi:exo-beta-1,3-glucanase (GH17 family)
MRLRSRPHAITYTPLTDAGACKRLADIVADLNRIYSAGVPALRLYSTDCQVLEAVIPTTNAARQTFRALGIDAATTNSKLKLTVGLFPYLDDESADSSSSRPDASRWFKSLDAQLEDLQVWNQWSAIELLSIGSGGLFDESYSAVELVAMLRHVRAVYGHPEIPLTTAEPVQSYVSHAKYNAPSIEAYRRSTAAEDSNNFDDDLCAAVDVIGITVHPYFNSAISAADAGKLVQRDIKFVDYLCSESFIGAGRTGGKMGPKSTPSFKPNTKRISVLEAGWPSAGADNGVAQPGAEAQLTALTSILDYARMPDTGAPVDVALYTFENEQWREPGVLKVETNFGVAHLL